MPEASVGGVSPGREGMGGERAAVQWIAGEYGGVHGVVEPARSNHGIGSAERWTPDARILQLKREEDFGDVNFL